ncbi:DUF2971 domain-containing protein [Dialister invisus]|uniref:DUF2971 domain-containing protein n=1 Tax=Dialister invisus TaxID=218538 RepID=UPI003FD7CE18
MESDIKKLDKIFYCDYHKRVEEIKKSTNKLVHYTSASAGLKILQNKEIWMRRVSCMNDFSEVQHGKDLFIDLWKNTERDIIQKLTSLFGDNGDVFNEVMGELEDISEFDILRSYITCFSEHLESEDKYGRLSMWRGYGKGTGIALVLKKDIFYSEYDAIDITTSPVAYLNKDDIKDKFISLVTDLEENKQKIDFKNIQRDDLHDFLIEWLEILILSIKHPAFCEEKEWRVISFENAKGIKKDIIDLNGMPQPVQKIPLSEKLQTDGDEFSVNEILDHIIIGPTQYAIPIYQALVEELEKLNVENAKGKVIFSDIPYRG